jgi:predicted Zn-dependent protease
VDPLQKLDILTINERLHSSEELIEVIWKALELFPKDLWEEVNYLGNLEAQHHVKIQSKDETKDAFMVDKLMKAIRALRESLEVKNLLLTLTSDPVIIMFYYLDHDGFKTQVRLVHDYVNTKVGVISLFSIDLEKAVKVSAHGLGHNLGLEHHKEPIDLMYVRLLDGLKTYKEGFCDECIDKIEEKTGY